MYRFMGIVRGPGVSPGALQPRRASEGESQPDALARDSTGNHAQRVRHRNTPFVPQGRATRLDFSYSYSRFKIRDSEFEYEYEYEDCGREASKVNVPRTSIPHPQPLSPKRGEGSGKPICTPRRGEGSGKPICTPRRGEGGGKPLRSAGCGEGGGKTIRTPRRGLTTLDILVSATLLSALIGTAATLILRTERIGREAADRMLALHEVANHLESKMAGEASSQELQPSETVLSRWPEAAFEIDETTDAIGKRVTVTLRLSKDTETIPIQLSGWVVEAGADR